MPRYFFIISDGISPPDTEGVEFDSPEEACAQAIMAAGETLRDDARKILMGQTWGMHVVTGDGRTVCRLKFQALN